MLICSHVSGFIIHVCRLQGLKICEYNCPLWLTFKLPFSLQTSGWQHQPHTLLSMPKPPYGLFSLAARRVCSRYKSTTCSADLKLVPFPKITQCFLFYPSTFLLHNDSWKYPSAFAEQEYASSEAWPPNEDQNLLWLLHPWMKMNDPRSCLTFQNDPMYVHFLCCLHILS